MEEESKENIIEIKPVSKWKRLLAFLGDYFIAFIIAFTLFNVAFFPLAKIIFNTQKQSEDAVTLEYKANNLLRDSGYLFVPTSDSSFEQDVDYTFKVFLSYYAFDEESPYDKIPQYGHKEGNEVIRKYYQDVIKLDQYILDFKEVNNDGMFDIGDDANSIALKSEYKTLLSNELLEVSDETKYSVTMTNFRDHVFAKLFYLKVYQNILDNDIVKDGVSYKQCLEESRDIMRRLQWVASGSAIFTIVFTWGIIFVLYPLLNKDHKTFAYSMMRVSKLHYKSLSAINKGSVMMQSFYQLLFCLSFGLFLPVLFFGMAYSFNLPLLFVLTIISLVLMIASGIVILFNQYNRSGADILTNTVLLPDSEIDMMYRVDDGK